MEILQVADEMVILSMGNYKQLVEEANVGNGQFLKLQKEMEDLQKENERIKDDKSVGFLKISYSMGTGYQHREFDVYKDHGIVKEIVKRASSSGDSK